MITAADMQSLHEVMSRPAYDRMSDQNMGVDPVTLITTAMSVASFLGLGQDKKLGFKQAETASKQAIATYGFDLATGARATGLDPNMTAQAASEYLAKDFGVSVSAAQLLAMSSGSTPNLPISATIQNNLPLLAIGAGAVLLYALIFR